MVLDNSGTAHPIQSNRFTGNRNAVVVFPDYYSTPKNLDMRCNTVDNPTNRAGTTGVNVLDLATLGDMGTNSTPNGNKFSGIANPVLNDGGIPFAYYRYNSAEEDFTAIGVSGITRGTLVNTGISGINACGGSANNGVNQRVAAGNDKALMKAVMDSLLAGQVPFARLKRYHKLLTAYHERNALMPQLEALLVRIPSRDNESFNTLGLRLVEFYTQTQQPARAQAVQALLLARSGKDLEVRYAVELGAILARSGPQPLVASAPLSAADQKTLRAIALSTTSRAPLACLVLRARAVPCNCTVTPFQPGGAQPVARGVAPASLAVAPAEVLGQSYPNPARTHATIAYELPARTREAALVIRDIATGAVRQRQPLPADSVHGQVTVELEALSQGVYIYSLEVDGKRLATKKMVVIH